MFIISNAEAIVQQQEPVSASAIRCEYLVTLFVVVSVGGRYCEVGKLVFEVPPLRELAH